MAPPSHSPAPRRRKVWRWLFWFGATAALVALVASLTIPWWLPAAVARVGASRGIAIGSWVSHGWSGTEYRDVVYTGNGVRAEIGNARVPVLGVFPKGDRSGPPQIVLHDVELTITPGPPRAGPRPTTGDIVRTVEQGWASLQEWLPVTRVDRAILDVGGNRFELGAVTWDGTALHGSVRFPWQGGIEGEVSLAELQPGRWQLSALAPAREASIDLQVGTTPGGGAELSGQIAWQGNAAVVRAGFEATGLLPTSASIISEAVSIPSADLGIEGYGPLTGSVRLEWLRDAYSLLVSAQAEPVAGGDWPETKVDLRAAGDLAAIRVEAVEVHLPGVHAALSSPVEWSFAQGRPVAPADFRAEINLASLPVLSAQGQVTGTVSVQSTSDGLPTVEFALAGSELVWRGVAGARIEVAGRWRDPDLVLDSAVLDLGPDARSEASATIDLKNRVVHKAVLQAVIPQVLLTALAPGTPPCERIELTATLDGPFAGLEHQGALAFLGLEWVKERRISGKLSWDGVGTRAAVEGELALAGGGSLPFAIEGERSVDGSVRASLGRAQWNDERGQWWALESPVQAVFDAASGELQISRWKLAGQGVEATGEARLRWPAAGSLALTVSGLRGERFGGVLPEAIQGGSVEELRVQADWDNGPVALSGGIRAVYTPVSSTTFAVEGEFSTQDAGLAFGSLEVLGESGSVLRGTGRLPLQLAGTPEGFRATFAREGPIQVDLTSEPNPVFWKSIADLTGWVVEDPALVCRFDGSLAAPQGGIEFSAVALQPPALVRANGGELPRLTGVLLKLTADETGVSVSESMAAIDDRWVTLSGHAPWTARTAWRESGVLAWRQAQFKLASNPLPIESASRVFPTELAPFGEVSIDIAHEPGSGMSGRIWLHGAALRPVGQLGSVRDIQSELRFEGYRMTLTSLEGMLSGQSVKIVGFADIEDPVHPEYELHVVSSRVPLVRQSGLIIRAEVDLNLKKERTGPARVSGRLDFGPSIFNADLLSLIPSGVDTPESRPPYFSVKEEPFAQWELDVAVHGEGFMRVTTPFYKDLLSTDLTLAGTLGEPRLIGWVWGAGGSVTFPFGTISAEQVLVTLSRENPFEPTLIASGGGRVLGYDVRMEASGPVGDPRLLFTSDPPLTSQQIFLMLSSGAVPGESNSIATTDRARRVAFFLGRNIASGLGLNSGGGNDRLVVRSGEDFTRSGGETIYVQYDLDGRWSLVGEYDRFDAYNGGLKFRIINR